MAQEWSGAVLALHVATAAKSRGHHHAMIAMGAEPERLYEVLARSRRRSLRTLYQLEWSVSQNCDTAPSPKPARIRPGDDQAVAAEALMRDKPAISRGEGIK